jgi:hypothetical protein
VSENRYQIDWPGVRRAFRLVWHMARSVADWASMRNAPEPLFAFSSRLGRRFNVRVSLDGTSCHFAAQRNLAAIGVMADIERATPIERDYREERCAASGTRTEFALAGVW